MTSAVPQKIQVVLPGVSPVPELRHELGSCRLFVAFFSIIIQGMSLTGAFFSQVLLQFLQNEPDADHWQKKVCWDAEIIWDVIFDLIFPASSVTVQMLPSQKRPQNINRLVCNSLET